MILTLFILPPYNTRSKMTIIDYIILLSSVFVGSIIAFYIKNISENNTKLLISFSGAYLFSITVLHLIPETFAGEHNHTIGLFILIGFFLQIILEQFSKVLNMVMSTFTEVFH